jgi:nicotinate-nucleotide pyrophosphorylase (carboxylating)
MSDADHQLLDQVRTLAQLAREEDLGSGDLTSQLLQDLPPTTFKLVARQPGILAGRLIADQILAAYDDSLTLNWSDPAIDGADIGHDLKNLATLTGPPALVLSAERVLLNFLQRLCGVATLTHRFVQAVRGTKAKILDTRKTIPAWRLLDKYAVRCGQGHNHRMGLHDAVMIKDNHIANVPTERLAAHVFNLLNRLANSNHKPANSVRKPANPDRKPAFIEVEADTLDQVEALLAVVGIDIILLDNFPPDQLRAAVHLRDRLNLRDKVQLEASGGITLDTVRAIADTGVDRISVGAITHSANALDLALDPTSNSQDV